MSTDGKKKNGMIKRITLLCILLAVLLLQNVLFGGDRVSGPEPLTLNVALYPYLANPEHFEQVLNESWKRMYPDIVLKFIYWDCYEEDPPADLDVFVFDTLYLSHFAHSGYLMELGLNDIRQQEDIIPFTLEGMKYNNKYYAIPQLACNTFLYYRNSDIRYRDFRKVKNIDNLYRLLGNNCMEDRIPPVPDNGLLIDLSGGTTIACYYIAVAIDMNGKYTPDPVLPNPANLDPRVINSIKKLMCMSGKKIATYTPDPWVNFQRSLWFSQGLGRASIDFSEGMSVMGHSVNDISLKLISFSNKPDIPLFYLDAAGINARISENKKEAALALANMIASTDVMIQSIMPPAGSRDNPAFLLPVRRSVFHYLSAFYPKYGDLYHLVTAKQSYAFRIGIEARTWIASVKETLKKKVYDAICCLE